MDGQAHKRRGVEEFEFFGVPSESFLSAIRTGRGKEDLVHGHGSLPCSLTTQMKFTNCLVTALGVEVPNFLTRSIATPKVKLAPLAPAIRIACSKEQKFGRAWYGPLINVFSVHRQGSSNRMLVDLL
jgi:hypothetical protein